MTDEPEVENPTDPENVVRLIDDPFNDYWTGHPIHGTNIDPEMVGQFREFAANVWNAARFDMAMRYSDLLLAITHEVRGEDRHDTAMRYIQEGDAAALEAKKRHTKLSAG
jgi:hypothetical protein